MSKRHIISKDEIIQFFNSKPIAREWSFEGYKPSDTNKWTHNYHRYPAKFIPQLVERLIDEYISNKNAHINDPFMGCGTTIDVCKEESRNVLGFDIVPCRADIKQADARKLPLNSEVADFVFIDSPYSDNIGNISCENSMFFEELENVAKEIHRILKPWKYMAWLIGDQAKKKQFVPVGYNLYFILEKYFKPIDIICVTRHNQSSNTPIWHQRAKKYNFFLRGFKYLLIMQKVNK